MSNCSVLILTLNEEVNIESCLNSVKWSDDVVVFDSNSTDDTALIAEKCGARVQKRTFDNYANQRNAGLQVEFKNDWILMLDADERVTHSLYQEILHVISHSSHEITLYRIRRKDYLFGKWLKRSSGYPTWFGRLAKVRRVNVKRAVNEEYHTDGKVGYLESHIMHFPFSKGFDYWIERHCKYATMEAKLILEKRKARSQISLNDFSDPVIRRRLIKQLGYKIPARPILSFIYLFIIRMGFMDGRAGLIYCILRFFLRNLNRYKNDRT